MVLAKFSGQRTHIHFSPPYLPVNPLEVRNIKYLRQANPLETRYEGVSDPLGLEAKVCLPPFLLLLFP